jgi:oxygen-dependent protoporphyrinogen oxidase
MIRKVILALSLLFCQDANALLPSFRAGRVSSSLSRQRAKTSGLRAAVKKADLTTDCLVVGAGISGATLAHNLHLKGIDLLLTEARDYVGGNVVSRNEGGFIWEEGPNSFATQPSVVRIAYELGIADQLVFADESLPPWVFHGGKLHPLPKVLRVRCF